MPYIRRCLENILDALLDLLHSGPGISAKSEIAKAMGRVGYILDSEFRRYTPRLYATQMS